VASFPFRPDESGQYQQERWHRPVTKSTIFAPLWQRTQPEESDMGVTGPVNECAPFFVDNHSRSYFNNLVHRQPIP
jgi:hypothetical protein